MLLHRTTQELVSVTVGLDSRTCLRFLSPLFLEKFFRFFEDVKNTRGKLNLRVRYRIGTNAVFGLLMELSGEN